jgi:cytoskeletal protein RodZ
VSGIGEELRHERVRQGLKLDDIAQRTRISLRSLESIEADAFDRLPGIVFARSFVRLYAIDLKLDADDLLSRLPRVDIDAAPLPNPPGRSGRAKMDPRLTAALASVLWLVTAGSAAMGAWYYFNHYGPHLMLTSVAAAPAPKSTAILPVNSEQGVVSQVLEKGAVSQGATKQLYDSTRPVQVVLTAHEATWVQISADGQSAFEGMLHPNDTRTIAADALVKILAGNAGGIDISLNGKVLDPIGPSGQVRTVRLTAEGPQFVEQNPPASSPL